MTVEDAEIKTFGNSITPQMQLASVESCSAECCPSDRPQRAGLGGLSGGSACDRQRYRLPCCSTLLRALSGHCLDDVQRQLAGQPPRCIPPAVPAVGDFAEIGLPRMCQRQGLISGKSGGRPKCRLIFAHECPAAGGVPHPCKCQQDIPCVVLQSIQQGWKQIMHSAPACSYPQMPGLVAMRAPSTRSARREKPRQMTVVPGGGSAARSRYPPRRAIALI